MSLVAKQMFNRNNSEQSILAPNTSVWQQCLDFKDEWIKMSMFRGVINKYRLCIRGREIAEQIRIAIVVRIARNKY
jgi:hypothetical protein